MMRNSIYNGTVLVRRAEWLALVMLLIGPWPAAQSASLTFSGTLADVFADSGTGVFAGSAAGLGTFGVLTFGNSAADAIEIHTEPGEAGYLFPGTFGGVFELGADTIPLTSIRVNLQNDHVLSVGEADLATDMLGFPVSSGTLIDVWSITGFSPGAFELDPTPSDGDDTEALIGGVRLEVVFASFDTSALASTDFTPMPPTLGDDVFGLFLIDEASSAATPLFSGFGTLGDAITVVPVPGGIVLLPAALAMLGLVRRRQS